MKRFLLFAGASYYACGGWNDYCAPFDTLQEAINHGNHLCDDERYKTEGYDIDVLDWWHVVDFESGTKVAANNDKPHGEW